MDCYIVQQVPCLGAYLWLLFFPYRSHLFTWQEKERFAVDICSGVQNQGWVILLCFMPRQNQWFHIPVKCEYIQSDEATIISGGYSSNVCLCFRHRISQKSRDVRVRMCIRTYIGVCVCMPRSAYLSLPMWLSVCYTNICSTAVFWVKIRAINSVLLDFAKSFCSKVIAKILLLYMLNWHCWHYETEVPVWLAGWKSLWRIATGSVNFWYDLQKEV
jgi:hypothetical protein